MGVIKNKFHIIMCNNEQIQNNNAITLVCFVTTHWAAATATKAILIVHLKWHLEWLLVKLQEITYNKYIHTSTCEACMNAMFICMWMNYRSVTVTASCPAGSRSSVQGCCAGWLAYGIRVIASMPGFKLQPDGSI